MTDPAVPPPQDSRIRARVVGWPAPPGNGAGGVYAVKICGLAPAVAAAVSGAASRRGMCTSSSDGDLIVEGSVRGVDALADEAAGGGLAGAVRDALEAARRALSRFRTPPALEACGRTFDLGRPLVVGILNATPDSFYDRGRYRDRDAAIARAHEMVAEGAGLIEVGGETARPGPVVDPEEETRRVVPLIEVLAASLPVPVSVDTYKVEVARRAVGAGAILINDISGLADIQMAEVAAASGAALVVMHIQGRPKVRQLNPRYRSVVDEVYEFLESRTARAEAAGVAGSRLLVDPGFSFGKGPDHDLEILRRLGEFRSLGYPIYLATSRKNYIRDLLGLPVEELLEGTAAAVAYGLAQGAHLVRTHDVRFMARLVRMMHAILSPGGGAAWGEGRLEDEGEVETRAKA